MLSLFTHRRRRSPYRRSSSRRGSRIAVLLAAVCVVLAGCGSHLLDTTVQTANGLKGQITAVKAQITAAQKAFDLRLAQADAAFMAPYKDQVEAGKFAAATAEQASASKLNGTLAQLVKDNKPEDQAQADKLIKQIRALLAKAQLDAKAPGQRAEAVVQTKANAATIANEAAAAVETINHNDEQLTAAADAQAKQHPAATIDKHLAPAHGWRTSADTAYASMKDQLKSDSPNYATVTDNNATIQAALKASTAGTPKLLTDLENLDHTVTRTLTDLKLTCGVTIGRTSWDDSLDYPDENAYSFAPVHLDSADACSKWMKFDDSGSDGTFAAMDAGWTGPTGIYMVNDFDENMWKALHLDPNLNWPGGDSAAEFYLNSVDPKYAAQFTETIDGVQTRTYWASVADDDFADYADNLGMDVYEKAEGLFPDEATTVAAPAGMAYVNNPHYGQWHVDNTGQSFWDWYGPYLFYSHLLGGNVYQNQYTTWHNHYYGRQPYYGSNGGHNRWGSSAPYIAATYASSDFIRTGGPKNLSTIRGAGPASRGRGPGGGGK